MTNVINSAAPAAALDAVHLPSRRRVLVAFSGLLLALLLAALDSTIVSTALPTIVGDLGGLQHLGEAFGRLADEELVAEKLRAALGAMADRDIKRQHIQAIIDRAGEGTLTPLAAWLMVRIEECPDESPIETADARGIAQAQTRLALKELGDRRLIAPVRGARPPAELYELTDRGCEVMTRLIDARRAHLADLAADWNPQHEPDVEAYLKEAVRSLVPDIRRAS